MFSDVQDSTISTEFCLVTLLILLIFVVNILHILYLIVYQHTKTIESIRLILINSSLSSLIVSILLIPFFYFRTIWSSESIPWRLWSFIFHVIDAVQIYSLFLLITTRSFQKCFIGFIWLTPIIAYSPLLWLTSLDDQIDYLPYRRLTLNIPSWILPILYISMYLIPILLSLIVSFIHTVCPLIRCYHSKQQKNIEHREDMRELTNMIKTVFNFQLEQSTNKSNKLKTWLSSLANTRSKNVNRSLSCQHKSYFLFDELSITPFIHSSYCIEQPLNYCRLFIITCLLLLVHLPYILLAFFDITSLQLSTFIYLHWFGTLFIPIIHIQ